MDVSETSENTLDDIPLLRQEVTRLRSQVEKLEAFRLLLSEARSDIVLFIGGDGRILDVNQTAVKAYGYDRETLRGMSIRDIRPVETHGEIKAQLEEAFRTGTRFETTHLRRDGSTFPVEVSTAGAEVGGQPLLLSIARDITSRKKAEQALRRSNEDLQQFAYVASHDLQEPLRTVSTFAQLMFRRYKGTFDKEGERILQTIMDAALRMGLLVNDLLAYSRITSEVDRIDEVVDLNETLADVQAAMAAKINEAKAEIVSATLPSIMGDPNQLYQVFEHVLSNAIKYRKSEQEVTIRVEAEKREGYWHLTFSDNGQGFASEYNERIFGIFKRLHGRDIAGTGIGLAICRTVVERHGGRMWAESEEGEGATFHLTLPAKDDR